MSRQFLYKVLLIAIIWFGIECNSYAAQLTVTVFLDEHNELGVPGRRTVHAVIANISTVRL